MGARLAWPIPSAQRECGFGGGGGWGEHGDEEEEAHTAAHTASLSLKNGDMEAPPRFHRTIPQDTCSAAPEYLQDLIFDIRRCQQCSTSCIHKMSK